MKLTRSEVEVIRIHMNAFKENLCNQERWNEAQEYQNIVDKLDGLLSAESVIRCKDCWCWNEEEQHGCTHDMEADDYCSKGSREEE